MDYSILIIIGIAVGLAVDAMAISISNSLINKKFTYKIAIYQSLIFGFFQFIAPVTGCFLGYAIKDTMVHFDHWIAFILLNLIGGNMIFNKEDSKLETADFSGITLFTLVFQGISTSIDALAIGVSFAMLELNIWFSSGIIGVVTFVLCLISSFVGGFIGQRLGNKLQEKAVYFGGILLMLIGFNILIEHLFF